MTLGRSKKAKTRKVEISFHSDSSAGEAHAAVNVKVYNLPEVNASDEDRERAYESVVYDFWQQATLIAQNHGYTDVFGEGRSDGWLVPFYQFKDGKLQQFAQWPGQGPQHGYPTYPDMNERKERERFVRFRADIIELLEDSKKEYVKRAAFRNVEREGN